MGGSSLWVGDGVSSSSWGRYVQNGRAYAAENFQIPAAGMVSQVQLFNPVGSGTRVRLRSLTSLLGLATMNVNVRRHDAPLTTLGPPAGFVVENLLGGGPAAVAEHRSQVSAAPLGSAFWVLLAPANGIASYPPQGGEWGHDLLPGQGIVVATVAVNVVVIVNWMWAEVPL